MDGPSTVSALLPWINGGGFATIALLFVWLIRTELPRREAAAATERRDREVAATMERKEQRDASVQAIGKLTDTFRDEMRLERSAHQEEMHSITEAWGSAMTKLEARLVVDEMKKERG